MDAENRRVLQFRCANTGRRFVAIFSRTNPTRRFKFVNAIDEKDLTGQEMPAPAWTPAKRQVSGFLSEGGVPITSLIVGVKHLLQNISKPKEETALEKQTRSQKKQAQGSTTSEFDMADFDFAGWYCPCCGHGKQPPVVSQFARCGRCWEYVCGGRTIRTESGQRLFRCHDRCGNSGFLGSGTLSSMSGVDFDVHKPSELEGRSGKLPPPAPRLPSGKDRK